MIPVYDELIEELRQHHCDAKEDDTQEVCEECAYDVIIADKSAPSGIASVCVCGLMNRAADAIEKLKKKLYFQDITTVQILKTYMPYFIPKWIPVTERLPETHDYVLCCGAKGGMFVGYVSCFTEPQGLAWAWQHGGQGRRIKWWMPLPQPPESEET